MDLKLRVFGAPAGSQHISSAPQEKPCYLSLQGDRQGWAGGTYASGNAVSLQCHTYALLTSWPRPHKRPGEVRG